ncbi:MAG: hypothetical protein PHO15_00365 [Eubacteriales bacterium]|nr:hypothetical protein [Eubacteriales bacterium]
MILDKLTTLRLRSYQTEALTIMHEFRQALKRHFDVVDFNARRLIDGRWDKGE